MTSEEILKSVGLTSDEVSRLGPKTYWTRKADDFAKAHEGEWRMLRNERKYAKLGLHNRMIPIFRQAGGVYTMPFVRCS